jgi:hypothetical protein
MPMEFRVPSRMRESYPTILAAAVADLEDIAESFGYERPAWLTITPFSSRVGTRRQTLIGRLLSWYDHHRSRSSEPWSDPLVCPIYRFGSVPRTPRSARRPGCWLLDANREREIWLALRNFSAWTDEEQRRIHRLREEPVALDVHATYRRRESTTHRSRGSRGELGVDSQ